jgi:hypothetical protein
MILAPVALNQTVTDESVRILAKQFSIGDRNGHPRTMCPADSLGEHGAGLLHASNRGAVRRSWPSLARRPPEEAVRPGGHLGSPARSSSQAAPWRRGQHDALGLDDRT